MTGVAFAANTIIVIMMCVVLGLVFLGVLAFLYWFIRESYIQKHGKRPRIEGVIGKIARHIKSWIDFHLYNHVQDEVTHPARHLTE